MVNIHIPMDLDIARTPHTRKPSHCMILPPAASILAYSSSLLGCKQDKWENGGQAP